MQALEQRYWWIGICPTCAGIMLHVYDSPCGRALVARWQGVGTGAVRLERRRSDQICGLVCQCDACEALPEG